MRTLLLIVTTALLSFSALAQPQRQRPTRADIRAQAAETALKQAVEELGRMKKTYERDLEVLARLRTADEALVDSMQPSVALQKAFEEVEKAKSLQPDFLVMEGIIRASRELEAARRSPGSADFDRLRSILRTDALGPAARVVVRNALRVEEEVLAWIRVQEQVAAHLRSLSEIASESLRASQP